MAILPRAVFLLALGSIAAIAAADDDPWIWLEEIEGERALAWAREQNERSLPVLESHPLFPAMHAEALEILTSKARIAYGAIHNGAVYNFWQDDEHVRGLWRRADVASYRSGNPKWEVLIDFDALARDENENWVHGDITCLSPEYRHCMVEMSYGGKDAAVWREFDTREKRFVKDGFHLPEAKTSVAWLDKDTLLVGTDRGEGSLTTSGYARTIVRLERGKRLKDAPVIFEGRREDVLVAPVVEQDGGTAHVFIVRAPSFFEREYHYGAGGKDLKPLPLPPNTDLQGVLDGRAIFFLREDWEHAGQRYAQGSVIAYELATGKAQTAMAAASNQSIEDVEVGKTGLVVQYLEDVSGKAARLVRRNDGTWARTDIALPANGVVAIISAGGGTDDAMLSFESLTVPDTLYYVDAENRVQQIAQAPAFFDASDVVVEQRFAKSRDGTRVPYFIMAKKDVLERGKAPTVQYGYGGFLAATLPWYYEDPARPQHGALAGKLWVSRGGVLVLSNIRGGSEYGPRWHQAALHENRQRAYDDFIAISEDLIARGVTTPEKLGAIGRSNGGLLMGVMLTQRPDLYAALDIGVPLFDMKRYTQLGAGASWMGEYGDPTKPEEWAYISKYSPYQNLKAGQPYPTVFIYTSTQDDRVHPGHARKAGARLAELGYEFLYYENMEGGHGGTANQEQLAYRTALEYTYFAKMLMD
jgi:prolyl oligopeptidase